MQSRHGFIARTLPLIPAVLFNEAFDSLEHRLRLPIIS